MDSKAISDQIEKILRSQSFASKTQLRKLLEILSKTMDSESALTPDLVIKGLWPEEIKTKRSADVATEMNRLRHALDSYYEGEGRSDTVTISLPNRAAPGPDGMPEKRWIAAKLSEVMEDRAPGPRASSHRNLKTIGAMGAIALLALVGYVGVRLLAPHDQPQSIRMDGSTLTVLNAEGKEIWRKVFPEGFSTDWYYDPAAGSRFWIGDLDGDSHSSVLFLYLPGGSAHSSTLICYSDRGKEKWRWTPGRALPELEGSAPTFRTIVLTVMKAENKKSRRIVVSSTHDPWYPDQIAVIDSKGKTISEYWHTGHLFHMILADLDGDGREEIIATGITNGYRQATLIVLDPDRVSGASSEPDHPKLQIHGMGAAQERLRLLFPRSDLNRALESYNQGWEVLVENGIIRLTVRECMTPPGCLVWYEIDRNVHLITAYAGDEFRSNHAKFYANRKDAHLFSREEEAEFRKVRCLSGCKSEFVPVEIP
jgi:hypothetical protein